MSTKDAYKQKIEAELESAQAKIATWKAKASNFSADLSMEFNKEAGEVEKIVESLKANLKELAATGENSWDKLKTAGGLALDSIAKHLKSLSDKIKD